MRVHSWGGMQGEIAQLAQPAFSSDLRECLSATTRGGARCLVVGNLRSYGDEVLNRDGHYVQTTLCDRILHLDLEGDTVTCECGITIDTLQRRLAPLGYMLPVTPGTAFLTVGGAIANDVHGKNHHVAGTFGCFVERFELVRSSGEAWMCSPTENSDWFAATIGGMGLTGAITRATLRYDESHPHFSIQRRADSRTWQSSSRWMNSGHQYMSTRWRGSTASPAAIHWGGESSAWPIMIRTRSGSPCGNIPSPSNASACHSRFQSRRSMV